MNGVSYIGSRAYLKKGLESLDNASRWVIVDTVTINREAIEGAVDALLESNGYDAHIMVICPWVPTSPVAPCATEYANWSNSVVARLKESASVTVLSAPKTAWEWESSFEAMIEHSVLWALEGASSCALISVERLVDGVATCAQQGSMSPGTVAIEPLLLSLAAVADRLSSAADGMMRIEPVCEEDLHAAITRSGFDPLVAGRLLASIATGFSVESAADDRAWSGSLARDVDAVLNHLRKNG